MLFNNILVVFNEEIVQIKKDDMNIHNRFNNEEFQKRIQSDVNWDKLNLSPSTITSLREICSRYKHIKPMSGEPGFVKSNLKTNSLSVVLSGLPGTGKTMAAQVIANDLELDLYRIDLSAMLSKYIGETEKNLDRVFAAENAILLFDEADALFGKQTEVSDANDRHSDYEIGYLLKKIEAYEGIVVFASNFKGNLDPAFIRRITYIIELKLKDEKNKPT